ncbi:hypothetical protein MAR_010200, partial [Mya arenaria]
MWYADPARLGLYLGIFVIIIGSCFEVAEGSSFSLTKSKLKARRDNTKKNKNKKSSSFSLSSHNSNKKKSSKGGPKFSLTNQNYGKSVKHGPSSNHKCSHCVHTQINIQNPFYKKPEPEFRCPGESVEMNCLSCTRKVYRECSVAGAIKITEVRVKTEYPTSKNKCNVGAKENFGIIGGSEIWVNYGCRAKFLVCYEKGETEPMTMNCMSTSRRHECPYQLRGVHVIIKVTMLWSYGTGRCTENKSWGRDKKGIWVTDNCSATFR